MASREVKEKWCEMSLWRQIAEADNSGHLFVGNGGRAIISFTVNTYRAHRSVLQKIAVDNLRLIKEIRI